MRILEFLNANAISLDLKSKDKEAVIKELIGLLIHAKDVEPKDEDRMLKTLLDREALGSTGIGQGVAIPHGKSNFVHKLVGAFGVSKKGVNFDSLDGEPAYIFFLLVAPEETIGPHLKALARISRLLKDKFIRDSLKNAKDIQEVLKIIRQEDEKKI
jgi:PTS system nitrogen regulatory IIA component